MLFEASLTDIYNVQFFASCQHLGKGFTALTRDTHEHPILPLFGLIHLDVALDRKHFLLHHLPRFFWQLGQMVIFDLPSESLHVEHYLDCGILHVLVRVADSRDRSFEHTCNREGLLRGTRSLSTFSRGRHFNPEGVDHLEKESKLGEQSFVTWLLQTVMLLNSGQNCLTDNVFAYFWMVGQVEEGLMDLVGQPSVAFFGFEQQFLDNLFFLDR